MDDLLIVRRSQRADFRSSRRPERMPLGAAFGLVVGGALGLLLSGLTPDQPFLGLFLGTGLGLAGGGLLGRFLAPRPRADNRRPPARHYEGMPFGPADPEPRDDAHAA